MRRVTLASSALMLICLGCQPARPGEPAPVSEPSDDPPSQAAPEDEGSQIADGTGRAVVLDDGRTEFWIGELPLFAVKIDPVLCEGTDRHESRSSLWRFDREDDDPVYLAFGSGMIVLQAPELDCEPSLLWHVAQPAAPEAPATDTPTSGPPLFHVTSWAWTRGEDGAWSEPKISTDKAWRANAKRLEAVAWQQTKIEDLTVELIRNGRAWVDPPTGWEPPPETTCMETRVRVWHDPGALMALDFELRTRYEICGGPSYEARRLYHQAQKSFIPQLDLEEIVVRLEHGTLVVDLVSPMQECPGHRYSFVTADGSQRLDLSPCAKGD